MLWVGDERSANTQDELRVDLTVRVFRRVQQFHVEFGGGPFAIWHADVGLQVSHG